MANGGPLEITCETTEVIICGCGPTGAMLSAQLGRARVANVVLEKELDITTDPRGIALDEDGIRALQSIGIYDKIYSEMGRSMDVFNFVSGVHQDLSVKPFMRMTYGTTEGGTGHVGFICHKQPVLEAHLRQVMSSTGYSTLQAGSTLTSIEEEEDWVYATYQDENGNIKRLRGKFLVGADGKTGFTRKKYLEPKGIKMEQASQRTSYEETWVALNWKMTLPTPKTHPEFPLWQLGYTPEQVYDLYFPQEFRFLCNPERPAVCGRFGLPEDRLWRFEFVVKKDEDGTEMATPIKIRERVHPYITHPASRYGLAKDVAYPNDCIEVLRSRPFWFSARSCNKWALNRVLLCGDSAHVFPPFGGQGIASGFRDACALAWRLQLSCRPEFRNYHATFSAWYFERKQQLERSLAVTVANGEYVTESNWIKIFVRDTMFWFLQLIPSWRRWIEMGPRNQGMVKYKFEPGMTFLQEFDGGACFPQVYCVPLSSSGFEEEVSSITFTDDVIFADHKRGLLQLVVLLDNTDEVEDARTALFDLDQLSDGNILSEEATYIIQKVSHCDSTRSNRANLSQIDVTEVFRIASASVFAKSKLCQNRPDPLYFDEYRMRKELQGKKFVIVRPDRFVFAACTDKGELEEAAKQISRILNGD